VLARELTLRMSILVIGIPEAVALFAVIPSCVAFPEMIYSLVKSLSMDAKGCSPTLACKNYSSNSESKRR
jgi:hypothetical protein